MSYTGLAGNFIFFFIKVCFGAGRYSSCLINLFWRFDHENISRLEGACCLASAFSRPGKRSSGSTGVCTGFAVRSKARCTYRTPSVAACTMAVVDCLGVHCGIYGWLCNYVWLRGRCQGCLRWVSLAAVGIAHAFTFLGSFAMNGPFFSLQDCLCWPISSSGIPNYPRRSSSFYLYASGVRRHTPPSLLDSFLLLFVVWSVSLSSVNIVKCRPRFPNAPAAAFHVFSYGLQGPFALFFFELLFCLFHLYRL